MATQVILLERVENLGNLGDVVNVKPGYARNYLLPQKKALRASKQNIAYFEAQKKHLEADNQKKKTEATKLAGSFSELKVAIIRQASETGQLYGSVNSRDIAAALTDASGVNVERNMVKLNDNFKSLGLFPVEIYLHPEVKVDVTINIARSDEEAKIQEETGKALVSEGQAIEEVVAEALDEASQLEEVLEESALEAQLQKQKTPSETDESDEAAAQDQQAGKDEDKNS